LVHHLGLNRTVLIVLVSVLFFGLGEQLWREFMPVYLRDQTRPVAHEAHTAGQVSGEALFTVGLFACLLNLFEGFCYIGGGQVTACLGDRRSLILFAGLTVIGYLLFLTVSLPWAAIVAALLILGWEPLSVPVTFTTVGATVDPSRRGMAFALQSIQKRLPKILGPVLGGIVLDLAVQTTNDSETGTITGMHTLVGVSLGLGLAALAIQVRWMPHRKPPPPSPAGWQLLGQFPPFLRRLLIAEVFKRWCDWLVREFVVLYLVFVHGVSFTAAGLLIGLQHVTALLTYLPIGRLTQSVGLQHFIGLTFIFFALFPLALALVPGTEWLFVPFIINGLREVGEPARKALITTSLPEPVRARGVGLYWGLRSFAICWASLVGAGLWYWFGPETLLYTAFALGAIGTGLYFLFVHPR
jgi:predicted MFS family arabinose efflux permease